MLFKVWIDRSQLQYFISTEVDRNTPWLQVSWETHMVPNRDTCQVEKDKLERYFKISKHHLISRREK